MSGSLGLGALPIHRARGQAKPELAHIPVQLAPWEPAFRSFRVRLCGSFGLRVLPRLAGRVVFAPQIKLPIYEVSLRARVRSVGARRRCLIATRDRFVCIGCTDRCVEYLFTPVKYTCSMERVRRAKVREGMCHILSLSPEAGAGAAQATSAITSTKRSAAADDSIVFPLMKSMSEEVEGASACKKRRIAS